MLVLVALVMSSIAGFGLTEALRFGDRSTALIVGTAMAAAASTEEIGTVLIGAVIGAVVGIAVDPTGSVWQRTRILVASIGTAFVGTIPLMDWLDLERDTWMTLFISALIAFIAYPILVKAHRADWWSMLARRLRIPDPLAEKAPKEPK